MSEESIFNLMYPVFPLDQGFFEVEAVSHSSLFILFSMFPKPRPVLAICPLVIEPMLVEYTNASL